MVEIRTPSLAPSARPAERVSTGQASGLYQAGASMQKVADKYTAYYEEKAADAADLIWAQTQADWSRRFNESAKTATDGFTGSTLEQYDAYVDEVLPTVPERQAENMQHMFSKYRIGLESKALEVEAAKRAEARAKSRAEAQRLRGLALQEDPTYANYRQISDGLKPENRLQLLGVYANEVLNGDSEVAVETFRRLLEDVDDFDDIITADQKRKLLDGVDTKMKQFVAEDKEIIGTMIDNAEAMINLHGEADVESVTDAIELSGMDREEKDAALKEVDDRLLFAQDTYEIRNQSFADSAAYMSDLHANAKTPQDVARLSSYSTAYDQHRNAIASDAAGYVIATDDSIRQLWDERTTEDDTQFGNWAYTKALDHKYDVMGVPQQYRRYLPVGVAGEMAATWNAQEGGVTGKLLDTEMAAWGDSRNAVFQELIAAKLSPMVQAQIWRSDDNVLSSIFASAKTYDSEQMADARKLYAAREDKTNADFMAEFRLAVSDYYSAFVGGKGVDASKFMLSMIDVAADAYIVHANNEATGAMSQEDFIKSMFREETITTSSAQMIVPPSVDKAMVESATRVLIESHMDTFAPELEPQVLATMMNDMGVDPTEDDITIATSLLTSNGVFVLSPDNTGVNLGYRHGSRIIDLGLATLPFNYIAGFAERVPSTVETTVDKDAFIPVSSDDPYNYPDPATWSVTDPAPRTPLRIDIPNNE